MFTRYCGTKYYFTSNGNKRMVKNKDLEQRDEQKVSFGKLESKLDKIINESPLKERSITQQTSARKLPGETQKQWEKRMRDDTAKKEKESSERAKKAYEKLHDIKQTDIPEAEAIPILIGKEMKEQLGKIKDLSQEYKQGIEMIKGHVTPEKQPPSDYEIDTSGFPKDPSYFDKKLNKEVFTSYCGTKYYFTSNGNKRMGKDEGLEQPEEQK